MDATNPAPASPGVGFAVGCASFVAAFAVASLLLGGLLLRWGAEDSNEFTLQVIGTVGFILVTAVATSVVAGIGLPRAWWSVLVVVGAGVLLGLFAATWMKPLVFESCTHGTGPQPSWCDTAATREEHVGRLVPHYLIAGAVLGSLAALAGVTRSAIPRSRVRRNAS